MKYFTIEEMCKSREALKYKLVNQPNEQQEDNIRWFVEQILDPIRENFENPIVINSGFRNKALNKLVGGKSNSYHLHGLAADIRPDLSSGNYIDLYCKLVRDIDAFVFLFSKLTFSKYIDVVPYSDKGFIHIEFDARRFLKDNPTKDYLTLTYK